MEGHWGQIVAMVPSHDVESSCARLDLQRHDAFDGCQFVSDVLETLPQ